MTKKEKNKLASSFIKLMTLEKKAQSLRSSLDSAASKWADISADLRNNHPEAWTEYCEKHGLYEMYSFSDILC